MELKYIVWGVACVCIATFVANVVERSTGNAWYGRGTGIAVAFLAGIILFLFIRRNNKKGKK